MDTNALLSKINKIAPGTVLEKGRFGKQGTLIVFAETRNLRNLGERLVASPELKLDWAEDLSVADVGGALMLTYILRSTSGRLSLILRATVETKSPSEEVEAPSLREIWPTLAPLENEAAELFGIRFLSTTGEPIRRSSSLLHEGHSGFPLRKAKRAK